MTQRHLQTFPFSCNTILQAPNWGCSSVCWLVFAGLIVLWPLLDWVAQQLPSGQTQLGWLKPTFVTFQKHVLSMRIYASHARNEGKKEIVISIHWLKWHQRVDSSKNRNHRAREGEKMGFMSPGAHSWDGSRYCLKPPQAVEVLTLCFSLSKGEALTNGEDIK